MISRCLIAELDLNNTSSPIFDKGILSQYIPTKPDGELSSCQRYLSPFDNTTAKTLVSCDGQFVYDTSIYQQSRVYEVRTFKI